jgi:hypothetical protein
MNNSATNLIEDLRLLEAPHPLAVVWWIAIVLAILSAVGLVLWRRARARQAQPTPAQIEAATEDALAELKKLRALIAVENSRLYAIQVSGITRRYIERRFGILAPRRSTEEFLSEAQRSSRLDARYQKPLRDFLAACDFLKFARAHAEVPELEQMHSAVVQFVEDTQPPAGRHIEDPGKPNTPKPTPPPSPPVLGGEGRGEEGHLA